MSSRRRSRSGQPFKWASAPEPSAAVSSATWAEARKTNLFIFSGDSGEQAGDYGSGVVQAAINLTEEHLKNRKLGTRNQEDQVAIGSADHRTADHWVMVSAIRSKHAIPCLIECYSRNDTSKHSSDAAFIVTSRSLVGGSN